MQGRSLQLLRQEVEGFVFFLPMDLYPMLQFDSLLLLEVYWHMKYVFALILFLTCLNMNATLLSRELNSTIMHAYTILFLNESHLMLLPYAVVHPLFWITKMSPCHLKLYTSVPDNKWTYLHLCFRGIARVFGNVTIEICSLPKNGTSAMTHFNFFCFIFSFPGIVESVTCL